MDKETEEVKQEGAWIETSVDRSTVITYINACEFLFEDGKTPLDYQRALFKHSAGMELNEDEGELLADLNAFLSLLCS